MKRNLLLFVFTLLVAGVCAQTPYERILKIAQQKMAASDYSGARKDLVNALGYSGLSHNDSLTVQRLIRQCDNELNRKQKHFSAQSEILLDWRIHAEDIRIDAGSNWSVVDGPSWCRVEKKDKSTLNYICTANTSAERSGTITIKMLNDLHYITIKQEAAPKHKVSVRAYPVNAEISCGGAKGKNNFVMEVWPGQYQINIKKDNYYSKDTTIVVSPENNEQIEIKATLKPRFGMAKVDVPSWESINAENPVRLSIGNHDINMASYNLAAEQHSLDDDAPLKYFEFYKGNLLPVYPGHYKVTMRADNLQNYDAEILINEGETCIIGGELQYRVGKLKIRDDGNAADADVIVDGHIVGQAPINIDLPIGSHKVTLEKEGYINESFRDTTIIVTEGAEHTLAASMSQYATIYVKSTPDKADVIVDGRHVGFTEADTTLVHKVAIGKAHKIEISKSGYMSYSYDLFFKDGASVREYHIDPTMEEIHPLQILCDEEGLDIHILRDNTTILSGEQTSTTVEIPYGKRLKLELYRNIKADKQRLAYRRRFSFTEGGGNTLKVLSWSKSQFHVLGANIFVLPVNGTVNYEGNSDATQTYRSLGSAFFGQFKLFPGVSTHILKTTLLTAQSTFKNKALPADSLFDDGQLYPNKLFGFSCLLLNGDFRLGGALAEKLDICILGSYTWYPQMTMFLPTSHFSGHDLFAGVELTTRMKVFNLNIRAGMQMIKGYQNILRTPVKSYDNLETKEKFLSESINASTFTVQLGFTLGGKNSKGQNIIRVF